MDFDQITKDTEARLKTQEINEKMALIMGWTISPDNEYLYFQDKECQHPVIKYVRKKCLSRPDITEVFNPPEDLNHAFMCVHKYLDDNTDYDAQIITSRKENKVCCKIWDKVLRHVYFWESYSLLNKPAQAICNCLMEVSNGK